MKRSMIPIFILALIVPALFLGCSGDDGAQGIPGEQGPAGPGAALQAESCSVCHNDTFARNGTTHQQAYDELFKDGVVVVTNLDYTNNGTNDIVTFNLTKNGAPYDCRITNSSPNSLGIYWVAYTGTGFELAGGRLSLEGTLSYDAGTNVCTSTKAQSALGDLSGQNGIVVVYGRDETLSAAEESPELEFTRVAQNKYPFAQILPTGEFAIGDYTSAANVAGCEKCHTIPFLKHGYIYGQVGGNAATDFYTCKACHLDNGEGGHFEWQLVVDDPPRWAEIHEEIEAALAADPENASEDYGDYMTAGELTKYAYNTSLMNDVHLSHAKEFPYPQSMSNCVVCHEGKLNVILSDEFFVVETCKSCHPQEGSATYTGGIEEGLPYQEVEPGDPTTDQHALRTLIPAGSHLQGNMPLDGSIDCSFCHFTGNVIGAPLFSQIHTGYDTRIYYGVGQKYSDAITVSIDNASFAENTNLLSFGFSAAGSAGGLSSANIVPTVLVGLYGYGTKDYIQGPHESDPAGNQNQRTDPQTLRALEFSVDSDSITGRNSPYITVTGGAGSWVVTADLSYWANLIAADNVVRVEVAVTPELKNAEGEIVALDAKSRTFDLQTNSFDDDFYPAIVNVANGCNNCHEALGRTFHDPDRGGSIVVCRLCHITKAGGSHLEMQSRSIDSYAHAIHSFQAFDPGDIDFTDPVLALHYQDHTRFAFPTLGRTNCVSCHNAEFPGSSAGDRLPYDVPDQTKSFPSISSEADALKGRTRNIGLVPFYIMGPASRACGGCHRANFINTDDAAELSSFNSHTAAFGYLIDEGRQPPRGTTERDEFNAKLQEDILEVINEIFLIF